MATRRKPTSLQPAPVKTVVEEMQEPVPVEEQVVVIEKEPEEREPEIVPEPTPEPTPEPIPEPEPQPTPSESPVIDKKPQPPVFVDFNQPKAKEKRVDPKPTRSPRNKARFSPHK